MEGRKLNSQQQERVIYVSALIGKQGLSDEERAAAEFCEDLKSLSEVSEVRGCSQKRMGQAMIASGLQNLKEGCNDPHKALSLAQAMMDAWEEFVISEEQQ
tara:strand:+ start:203 stop:505 length:303 start_codon:yes stop_codon:yes gene_type:complete